jgi:hypothetical protein
MGPKKNSLYDDDMPDDIPEDGDEIWESLGIEFDDDDQRNADLASREGMINAFEEEDRQEYIRKRRTKILDHEHPEDTGDNS